MDDMSVDAKMDKAYGGDQLKTVMKFDRFFMYGMDNMGGRNNSAPECKPNATDPCKKESGKSCCAHVVMTEGNGEQMSVYRCMNERVVDMAFNFQIDGMSLAMSCSKSKSSASYITGVIMASIAAIGSMAFF